MAVKSFKPNLQGADLEKIKAVCYPCTSQNDCSRRLNNKQATVEECNGAYKLFDIDPPPADYSAPRKLGRAVGSTNSGQQGGLGTVLFAAFLPMSSYSSSCILSLCSIYFVVSAAAKQ
ncbi:hypothetical protein BpV1_111c [Bathycoccus sp. RCC1105 virus BpV1]|uniref:hypothetical protein n=1 Tax=Bathycoccus sp. RCC1105 virus BpV1 TaxID=880159 RepID=UPI0001EF4461|nr:hypothetical protein BpV1_111c [Bathycoccus sp. RCC1105 virus BpV1]ADQ91738.1 hypothetical protein BpV1_111c [Bathycoccus sp. RCC1105 virus BpV1]